MPLRLLRQAASQFGYRSRSACQSLISADKQISPTTIRTLRMHSGACFGLRRSAILFTGHGKGTRSLSATVTQM
jgi:hypothetical protein